MPLRWSLLFRPTVSSLLLVRRRSKPIRRGKKAIMNEQIFRFERKFCTSGLQKYRIIALLFLGTLWKDELFVLRIRRFAVTLCTRVAVKPRKFDVRLSNKRYRGLSENREKNAKVFVGSRKRSAKNRTTNGTSA